jgi:tRNA-binding EMAP/Myf-like protein
VTSAAGEATWADFERVSLRAGTIRKVEPFPEARRPAYKLWIDLGPFGIKQPSAQLTVLYTPADLVDRQVVCAATRQRVAQRSGARTPARSRRAVLTRAFWKLGKSTTIRGVLTR